jgi:hypothetical protein
MGFFQPHGRYRRGDEQEALKDAITLSAWIGIPGAILLIVLVVYGFRQGMKVTPGDGSATNNQNDYPPPG